LPLLLDIRCFPSDRGIGLNALDISLAINSSPLPSFRSFSSGGFDTTGTAVRRNPDLELTPKGGFNPTSSPPGAATTRADDNSFYIGQIDVVTRVARVHTIWLDTEKTSPDLVDPVILPDGVDQPSGTQVIVEYRGSAGFDTHDIDIHLGQLTDESLFPFDAQHLNAYGDIFAIYSSTHATDPSRHAVLGSDDFGGQVMFTNGVSTWSNDIDSIDGSRFVQMRFTFLSNMATGLSPELSGVGIAYAE
jgi:hypothetical protein